MCWFLGAGVPETWDALCRSWLFGWICVQIWIFPWENVQYDTYAWTEKSFSNLINWLEEIMEDLTNLTPPDNQDINDLNCEVFGSHWEFYSRSLYGYLTCICYLTPYLNTRIPGPLAWFWFAWPPSLSPFSLPIPACMSSKLIFRKI